MSENEGRRRGRVLSPEAKWEVFLQVTSREMSQAEVARKWEVDVSTVIGIRRTAKDAALGALVARRGRPAKERNWERRSPRWWRGGAGRPRSGTGSGARGVGGAAGPARQGAELGAEAARREVEQLTEAVKAQAIELALLRGKVGWT